MYIYLHINYKCNKISIYICIYIHIYTHVDVHADIYIYTCKGTLCDLCFWPVKLQLSALICCPNFLFLMGGKERMLWICCMPSRRIENTCNGPSREFVSSIYQFRTICSEVCETLHLVDKNLKLDPPVENMEKQKNWREILITIFSEETLALRIKTWVCCGWGSVIFFYVSVWLSTCLPTDVC